MGGIAMREQMVIELVAKEKTYTGRELAEVLGIGASTLRKWCMLLERHGYRFQRDGQNRREYRQADVVALRTFFELTREKMMPMDKAAAAIVNRIAPSQPNRLETAAALAPRTVSRYDELERQVIALAQHVQNQDAVQMALLERLEKQERYIRSTIKERDRRLTKAMNDILETKVQLAKLQDQQRKTSIWHRLFPIR
jgi:DNA-binding transcriptional MerR regulator